MRHPRTIAILAVAAGFIALAATGTPAMAQAPDKYLEMLRSDLRTGKVEILTEALDLTPQQSDAFWPIYREYDTELSRINDRRVALVKKFAATYGSTTEEQATSFAREWFTIQEDRTALRKKYFGKVAKATTSIIAARFLQVEHLVNTLVDLQIAAELPLVE